MIIRLKNNVGMIKECKVGFSWTNFFLGFFVPMFRGDWKFTLIQLAAAFMTCGISNLVFPFFYNKVYINDLLEKGYTPATEVDRGILVSKGFIADDVRQED